MLIFRGVTIFVARAKNIENEGFFGATGVSQRFSMLLNGVFLEGHHHLPTPYRNPHRHKNQDSNQTVWLVDVGNQDLVVYHWSYSFLMIKCKYLF